MKKTSHKWYWISLAATCALCVAYVKYRDLPGRYETYQERDAQVRSTQADFEALDAELARATERAEQLVADPLEIESAIRRYKQRVRPGETVYRIEETPSEGTAGPSAPASE